MYGLTKGQVKFFKTLNTPKKIQDYINEIPINFEEDGKDTCYSPKTILEKNKCHCIEGALLAALILRIQGYPPLVIDIKSSKDDFDHVVAVFQKDGMWGAISKTNHAILRYREPIYQSIRELVMSFFHEYISDDGKKTLRSFSDPVNLEIFDTKNWVTEEKNLWYIADHLDKVPHHNILTRKQIANLRKPDEVELKINDIVQFKSPLAKKNF